MTGCGCESEEGESFWRRVDQAHARDVVASALSGARAQVGFSLAYHAAERAEILLGPNAGVVSRHEAEVHRTRRNGELRLVARHSAHLVESLDPTARSKLDSFFKEDAWAQYLADARRVGVEHLLQAAGPAEDTKNALRRLDAGLKQLGTLSSTKAVLGYLQSHVDDIVQGKAGNPNADGWCELILILSSVFAVLVVIAVLICVLTLGLGCSGILQQLINQACG